MALLNGKLDGRERVLDLVRESLSHLLPSADSLEVLDPRPRLLHLAEHAIEDAGELGQLVGASDRNADVEVAGGHLVDGHCEPADSPRDTARER